MWGDTLNKETLCKPETLIFGIFESASVAPNIVQIIIFKILQFELMRNRQSTNTPNDRKGQQSM